jgi:hypothetical protein
MGWAFGPGGDGAGLQPLGELGPFPGALSQAGMGWAFGPGCDGMGISPKAQAGLGWALGPRGHCPAAEGTPDLAAAPVVKPKQRTG